MNNYKIKVNSADESKEAQELFFELGYVKENWFWSGYNEYPIELRTRDGGYSDFILNAGNAIERQEITLAELRDMVVLKRNDQKDRTHVDSNSYDWYVASDEKHYRHQGSIWVHQPYVDCLDLKPIEKQEMKEYVNKTTGEYRKTTEKVTGEQWVEVDSRYNFAFKKTNGDIRFSESCFNSYFGEVLLWQRPTQPEELPFIDDEPTLDKIKIKVDGNLNRAIDIAKSEGYCNCQFNKIPEGAYWLLCNEDGTVDYSMNENILNEYMMLHDDPESLNNQYAEIEQVRQDVVNHPEHYTQGKVECIDALEAATVGKVGIEAVCVANVIKYLWRYEEKNGKEDIKKAQWYLNKLLDSID